LLNYAEFTLIIITPSPSRRSDLALSIEYGKDWKQRGYFGLQAACPRTLAFWMLDAAMAFIWICFDDMEHRLGD
jgi:hypothetical protein